MLGEGWLRPTELRAAAGLWASRLVRFSKGPDSSVTRWPHLPLPGLTENQLPGQGWHMHVAESSLGDQGL